MQSIELNVYWTPSIPLSYFFWNSFLFFTKSIILILYKEQLQEFSATVPELTVIFTEHHIGWISTRFWFEIKMQWGTFLVALCILGHVGNPRPRSCPGHEALFVGNLHCMSFNLSKLWLWIAAGRHLNLCGQRSGMKIWCLREEYAGLYIGRSYENAFLVACLRDCLCAFLKCKYV